MLPGGVGRARSEEEIHGVDSSLPTWIQNTLALMDKKSIDHHFNYFCDSPDKSTMSAKAFWRALRHFGVVKDEDEVNEVMKRFDTDGNGAIDVSEFHSALHAKSKMEMMLDGLPLIRALNYSLMKQKHHQERGASPIEGFLELSREDIRHALMETVDCWLEVLWLHHERLAKASPPSSQGKSSVSGSNEKYLFEMRGGSIEDFNSGISSRIGGCSANPVEGMREEHTVGADCDMVFTTRNYGITTTARIEYNLATTGGRYYKDLALDYHEGKTTILDTLPSDIERELVLSGGEAPKGNGPFRILKPLSSYMHLLVTQKAKLSRDEILAVVLYTGPMYTIWNAALRRFPKELYDRLKHAGNLYASSIHILSSAIKKIQQTGHALEQNTVLYRGLSGAKLPDELFCRHPKTGKVGLTEFGVQSTTSDLNVAVDYSGVHGGYVATVLAVKVSQVDSGAYLGDYSQYPSEKEYLWASMSYLQAEGEGHVITTPKGQLIRVVPVRINTNGRTMTLAELQAQRKEHVCQIYENIVRETARELEELKTHPSIVERARKDPTATMQSCMDPYHPTTSEPSLQNTMMVKFIIENKLPDWFKTHVTCKGADWFNKDDSNYKSAISQTVDLKRLASGMVWYWVEHEEIKAFDILFLSLEEAEERRIARLQAHLKRLRETWVSRTGRKVPKEIQSTAKKLCKLLDVTNCTFEDDQETLDVLFRQAQQGNSEAVRLLLEAGANVNGRSERGMTPLMAASGNGHLELIKIMCDEFAADANATDDTGMTPLMHACVNGSIQCVSMLRQKQANPLLRDDKGRLAVMRAAAKGHLEVVRFLIEEDEKLLKWKDRGGLTTLMHAAQCGQTAIVEYLLLDRKDIPIEEDKRGSLAFTHAAANGHLNVMNLLLNHTGVFSLESNPATTRALHMAATNGHTDVVRTLLAAYQVDVETKDDEGRTALMHASENGHREVLLCLAKEFNANVNAIDNEGRSALLYAAYNGDKETLMFLALELDAFVELPDANGMTALDYAKGKGEHEIVSLLEWLSGDRFGSFKG